MRKGLFTTDLADGREPVRIRGARVWDGDPEPRKRGDHRERHRVLFVLLCASGISAVSSAPEPEYALADAQFDKPLALR
ncbi:MAG: hypothetical protein Kow00106_00390 [Anaerolineae bacterium]